MNMITRNMGKTEIGIRVLLGLLIAGLGIAYQSWWGLIAIIPLGTAALGYCPLWSALGVNTRSESKPTEEQPT